MTQVNSDNSKKIVIIAQRKIGKFKTGDEITVEKYAARVLVAMGKAKFKNESDEFRKFPTAKKKRARNQYQTRDMTAQ